ncbi:MAG TPA: glycosyltransferase [Noviherbaspirillum sp.]
MKILIVHNAYQHAGGEDTVVEAEMALLRAHGHKVTAYAQHNNALNGMPRTTAALNAVWSQQSSHAVESLCEQFRPDVIHAHNTFPLISPSLYWTASKIGIPVVQTLHNFRLLCPQANFLRNGKICEDCIGKLPWRSVAHKCYRQSAAQSTVATVMLAAHRLLGTYRERVTRYIALNRFARDKYVQGGLPLERLRIKPNFVQSDTPPQWEERSGGLYVGRFSVEKGLAVLAAAAPHLDGVAIKVIGSGPQEALARAAFGEHCPGFEPLERIMSRMQSARYLIVPSICHENSPRTIIEAFACGLPVIASRLGALADIVHDGVTGLLFTPGDAADLARCILWAESHPEQMLRMGRAARAEYEAQYTPERNYEILMDIYEDAIATTRKERRAA